jgi:acetyltransferase
MGVEDILEYWDESFDPETSSRVKLIYVEEIADPEKFLKHSSSLIRKGCHIAAIKAGTTEAGSRAVSSHTGALAGSDVAVDALFRKAGIVRCYSRVELVYIAGVFCHKQLTGDRVAVITHAGGSGVMLTDSLSQGGLKVPKIDGEDAKELLGKLYFGSSVANPIDFLATGNAEQLGTILDYVDDKFDNIDGSAVIFGTTGMFDVTNVYDVLNEKMKTCKKPIYPVLPSVVQAAKEVNHFLSLGRINFTDEVSLGRALSKVYFTPKPFPKPELPEVDMKKIREIIDDSEPGYISPAKIQGLLDAAGIPRAKEAVTSVKAAAVEIAGEYGFPLVMKVVGPVHKSDVGGVALNIKSLEEVGYQFDRMMQIEDAKGVLIQPMLSGTELFVGAKFEPKFGHIILCGLGGIFIEVFKDVASGLAPIGIEEARYMIRSIKAYPIIQGIRGKQGVDEEKYAEVIVRVSALLKAAPEIMEMDINPLLGNSMGVTAVDARIRIEKK